jgi:hypothetical protein
MSLRDAFSVILLFTGNKLHLLLVRFILHSFIYFYRIRLVHKEYREAYGFYQRKGEERKYLLIKYISDSKEGRKVFQKNTREEKRSREILTDRSFKVSNSLYSVKCVILTVD